MSAGRLIVVSNRLPVALSRQDDGTWTSRPSSGGLVTAIVPVLRDRGGVWIGWPGTVDEEQAPDLPATVEQVGFTLRTVRLNREEQQGYYDGFSNEVLWPLFHDLQSRCNFVPEYWRAYLAVNEKFAAATAAEVRRGDTVWIHDYHLMAMARRLRELGVRSGIDFFLHIPFPAVDIFAKLPWRQQLLEHLLEFDLVGLQTPRDRRNFLACVEAFLPGATIDRTTPLRSVEIRGRTVRVGAFPIGIDAARFTDAARSVVVASRVHELREDLRGRRIILGIDRLDYTKGIPHRLDAYADALRRHPELQGTTHFVQVMVPSRISVPEYGRLRDEVERTVGSINGELGRPGWVPVHYLHRSLDRQELLAFYRAADVGLVTPLKDGMNLVAKEYCACQVHNEGVLILSEFAGAAWQLQRGAVLVNPYDVEGVADAIAAACSMPVEERRRRMRMLRRNVREQDIFWWVGRFLRAAIHRDLEAFPLHEERAPGQPGWSSEAGLPAWVPPPPSDTAT